VVGLPPENLKTASHRPVDRGVARKHAFLDAARDVFLTQGYEAASVNDVVRIAGGSLATLYAQFGNKEGLFLAVAQDQHERFVRAITPECVDNLPLEQGLQVIGEQFLKTILEKDHLAFYRITVGEARKFPQLMQRNVSANADKVRDVVANHIRAKAPECEDANTYASYFLSLLLSRHHYRALADSTYVVSDEERREHVASAVRFLVRAIHGY
jgi:AcrR family transcriptional regulator